MTGYEKRLLEEYFPDGKECDAARLRIENGEPAAYVIGEQAFYTEIYKVTPAVLIPRFDTERVVDKLIGLLPRGGRFLDLCTGSGCIAVSALVHRPDAWAFAADISRAALDIAEYNAAKYGVTDRITFAEADILDTRSAVALASGGPYDIVVSNPPYIPRAVVPSLDRSVSYEPVIALDGGGDGLDFYRAILRLCRAGGTGGEGDAETPHGILKTGGLIIFEIGYDQAEALKELAESAGCPGDTASVEVTKDWGGNDRVAVVRFDTAGELPDTRA